MVYSIRSTTKDDSEAVSKICLLTSNFGTGGEHLHHYGELPGLVYAVPYVNTLPTTFAFVLVSRDESGPEDAPEDVIGYVLGTWDTPTFLEASEKDWFPPIRAKYPLNAPEDTERTEADQKYISRIHEKNDPLDEILYFSPVHLHINILPQAQRQGWGKKLIGKAVKFIQEKDSTIKGLWVGIDPRNEEGKKFYTKVGFTSFPGDHYTLKFSEWKD